MPRRGCAAVSIFWRPIMGCQRASLSLTCTSWTTSRRGSNSFRVAPVLDLWWLARRRFSERRKLAQALQAKALLWEEFPEYLVQADIVLSSTSAPQPIIQKAMIQEVMRVRKHRPMFFIDIAVPRDIDPAIHTLENVFLYDMDALENVVAENYRARQQAALVAEGLVWRQVRHFHQWLAAREAAPTIVALRQWAETTRREELDK